jgi:glycosyltransferase 2 family protein
MNKVAWLRVLLTPLLLIIIVVAVGPRGLIMDFKDAQGSWLFLAFCLTPFFLFCRVYKWMLLERQLFTPVSILSILPRYLWGVAIGLITPLRAGELLRLRNKNCFLEGSALFLMEKLLEVASLLLLCFISLGLLGYLGWHIAAVVLLGALGLLKMWPLVVKFLEDKVDADRFPLANFFRTLSWAISNLKIFGCLVLSICCFVLFAVQVYVVLIGLGIQGSPVIILLCFVVFLAHLLPITIGGYGLREGAAILVFSTYDIPESKAAISVALVTFFNLVVPGVLGIILKGLGVRGLSNE